MERNVYEYIKRQKTPIRELCVGLRRLILAEFPGIKEEVWIGVPWYGRRFYIAAFKDHVNLGLSIEGFPEKELSIFEGSGRFMRHVKIFPKTGIERNKILELLRIARKSRCSCR